jgi:hypothetical protein
MRTTPIRLTLLLALLLAVPIVSSAGIILSIGIAPPPLPVYEQPACPGDGYIWTPGYWAYADDGYFWVPGTWVLIPEPGYLWTPGYWGWGDGLFAWHEGYWGLQIGFYGGVNYGFGYIGVGYEGGYWRNGAFFYNRSVNNVVNITNVYEKNVVVNNRTYVSYNGGEGGITARPTTQEEAAASQRHLPPTSAQTSHVQAASGNHQLYESVNHGKPAIAATAQPSQFSGSGVAQAKSAAPSYKPAEQRSPNAAHANTGARNPAAGENQSGAAKPVHPKEATPQRPAPVQSGNPDLDRKFQKEQQDLNDRQDKERQNLQQKQEQEHQQRGQTPQVEQQHQQQTQQLEQKHSNQQQQLQQRQQSQAHAAPRPKH